MATKAVASGEDFNIRTRLPSAIIYTAVDLMPTNKIGDLMDKPLLSAKSVIKLFGELDINLQKTNLSLAFKQLVKGGFLYPPTKQGRINYYRVNWEKVLLPISYNLHCLVPDKEDQAILIMLRNELSNKYMKRFFIEHLRDELKSIKKEKQIYHLNHLFPELVLKVMSWETLKKYDSKFRSEMKKEDADLLKFSMNISGIGTMWKAKTANFYDRIILHDG